MSSADADETQLSDDNFAAVEYERNLQNLAQAAHSYWKSFVESEDYRGNSTFQDYDDNDKLLWRMAFMRFMTETMVPDMLTGFELNADGNVSEEKRRIADAVEVATYTVDSMPKKPNRMHEHLNKEYKRAKRIVKHEAQRKQELKKHNETINDPHASAKAKENAKKELLAAQALDAIINARGPLSEAKARAAAENRRLTFQEQEQIAQTTANIISEINTAVGKLQTGKDTIDQAFAQIAKEELKDELKGQPDKSKILEKVQQLKKAYYNPRRGLYHIVAHYKETHAADEEEALRALAINEVKDDAFREDEDQSKYELSEEKIQEKMKDLQKELRAEEKKRKKQREIEKKIMAFKQKRQPRAKKPQAPKKPRKRKLPLLTIDDEKTNTLIKTMAALAASRLKTGEYDENDAKHVFYYETFLKTSQEEFDEIGDNPAHPMWRVYFEARQILTKQARAYRSEQVQAKAAARKKSKISAGAGDGAGSGAGSGAGAKAGAGDGDVADVVSISRNRDGSLILKALRLRF